MASLTYVSSPETAPAAIAPTYGHFIGGAFVPSSGDARFATVNPATDVDRAAYVYRIARAISERWRELAVLETVDNGKPIKESRDFDVPQASSHFFYYAGWADKLAYATRGGRRPNPLGVVGATVPWKNTDIGGINSRVQLERIQELVASGVAEGATLHSQRASLPSRGSFVPASFFTGVGPSPTPSS